MAGKKDREPIRVVAYAMVNGVERNVDDLEEGERERLGTALRLAWLNTLFAGRAIFYENKPT